MDMVLLVEGRKTRHTEPKERKEKGELTPRNSVTKHTTQNMKPQ